MRRIRIWASAETLKETEVMATFPNGTAVKLVGLPADHGALCNAAHGVVQGSSSYLGRTLYAIKTHTNAQATFFPIDAANVVAATNPSPPLGVANVVAWNAPAHHAPAP
jgi:hypothetical protein